MKKSQIILAFLLTFSIKTRILASTIEVSDILKIPRGVKLVGIDGAMLNFLIHPAGAIGVEDGKGKYMNIIKYDENNPTFSCVSIENLTKQGDKSIRVHINW